MVEKLKACPFCEGLSAIPYSTADGRETILCEDCGAEGPSCQTPDEAIAAWNRRSPAEAREMLEVVRVLAEIRHQNQVNIEYARRENPKDSPFPHVFEVLAGHITDRLNEADAAARALAQKLGGVDG